MKRDSTPSLFPPSPQAPLVTPWKTRPEWPSLLDSLPRLSSLKTIRLVLFSDSDCDRHREVLRQMA